MTTITASSSEADVSRWLSENKFTEYIQYVLCNWNGKAMLVVKCEILEKMIGVEGFRVYTLLHADNSQSKWVNHRFTVSHLLLSLS